MELSHRNHWLINGCQCERLNIGQHACSNQIFCMVLMDPMKIACTSIFSFPVRELFISFIDFQEVFKKKNDLAYVTWDFSGFTVLTDKLEILTVFANKFFFFLFSKQVFLLIFLPRSYWFESLSFWNMHFDHIYSLNVSFGDPRGRFCHQINDFFYLLSRATYFSCLMANNFQHFSNHPQHKGPENYYPYYSFHPAVHSDVIPAAIP